MHVFKNHTILYSNELQYSRVQQAITLYGCVQDGMMATPTDQMEKRT